jgi:hypothetical protein
MRTRTTMAKKRMVPMRSNLDGRDRRAANPSKLSPFPRLGLGGVGFGSTLNEDTLAS